MEGGEGREGYHFKLMREKKEEQRSKSEKKWKGEKKGGK